MLKMQNTAAPARAAAAKKTSPTKGYQVDKAVAEGLLALETEYVALERLADQAFRLESVYAAIESHGLSDGLLAFVSNDELLSTTAMGSVVPSLESYTEDGADKSALAIAATEGILGAIGEKIAGWAKGALEFITNIGARIKSVAGKVVSWASDMLSKAKDATFDAARAAKEVVVAHPYATAAAVIGGIAALSGIGAVLFAGVPASQAAATATFSKVAGMVNKIGFPGLKASVVDGAVKLNPVAIQPVKNKIASLGWSKQSVVNLLQSTIQTLKQLPGQLGSVFANAMKMAKGAASSAASGVKGAVTGGKELVTGAAGKVGAAANRLGGRISAHAVVRTGSAKILEGEGISKWQYVKSTFSVMKNLLSTYFFKGLGMVRDALRAALKFLTSAKGQAGTAVAVASAT